jgi:hypothetical protein
MEKAFFWVANKIDSCFKRNAENQPITLKVETLQWTKSQNVTFTNQKNPSILILRFHVKCN